MKFYKIGEIANKLQVSAVTLRHYEKIGLVTASQRSNKGYRLYNEQDIKTLKFVLSAKSAGLSLSDIKALLDLADKDLHDSQPVKQLLQKKIGTIKL